MKPNRKYRLFFFSIMISFLLVISACGKDNSTSEPGSDSNQKKQEDLVLDSEMGEVNIPKNVERIIAAYHEDTLLALGITPVVKWSIGKSIQDYLETDLKDIPSIEWNLPLEQVLDADPDLIILENNLDSYEGNYADYNKIAPTYVMKKDTTEDWRNQIEVFGEILGKEDKAKDILANYEEKIAEASANIKDSVGNETVAAIWVTGDQFFLFEEDRHSAEVLYSELGINPPALVEELGEAKEAWNPISIEKLSELDADHVFLLASEGEQGMDTLKNSSVWQSTTAAKEGNIYVINDPSNWTNKGLNASEQTIDDVMDALLD